MAPKNLRCVLCPDQKPANQQFCGRPLDGLRNNNVLDGMGVDRSENMHRLFMYPAMMVPQIQSLVLNAISNLLPRDTNVLDPFMGSGTSLLSCMEFGYNLYGQDINPLAVLITRSKTGREEISLYLNTLELIKGYIKQDESESIDISFKNIDKWFMRDVQIALSRIRRAIKRVESLEQRSFFWVVMAECVRTCSNDRTSTFKLHLRSTAELEIRRVDCVKTFLNLSERGIEDLKRFREKLKRSGMWCDGHYVGDIELQWGDSQVGFQTDKRFDLLLSSPPYGDNHTTVTYGQTSYLPLQWIDPDDLECGYDYLLTTREIDSQSLGGRSLKIMDYAEKLLMQVPSLKKFLDSIPQTEQKNYMKTIKFVEDFQVSLGQIVKVMKPNAYYVWTIGNRFVGGREIPNNIILKELMATHGLVLVDYADRRILNKKQPRKNNYSNTMEKEQILIFH